MIKPRLTPRPKQELTIQQALADKSHLSGSLGGFGKTLVGSELILRSGASVSLIVCPLKVIRNWKSALDRQTQTDVDVKQISGTKKGKLNFLDLTEGVPGVYIVGWEMFRSLHWGQFKFDVAIADECHRAANRRSKTGQMLQTVKAEYKLALSATPAGNRLEGIWNTAKWLWPDTKAYWPWVSHFFNTVLDPYEGKAIVGERRQGAVWESLPSATRFAPEVLNGIIDHEIVVDLAPAQRKLYNQFEATAIAWLDDHPLVADMPAVKGLRLRQMTLGVPTIEIGEDGEEIVKFAEDCKSSKIDALVELLGDLYADEPFPVVVYCHSRKFTEIVAKRLQAKGYRAVDFVGGQKAQTVSDKITGFGKDHDIIVATIAAIGEGVDGLQEVCNTEVWLSLDDNRILNTQARWRLDRPDAEPRTINRYLIRAEDTIETRQLGRLRTDDELLSASLDSQMEAAA